MQSYQDVLAEILITAESLKVRVAELGALISADYSGRDLLLICILRGGVPFLVDLSRSITVPHMIDFMAVLLYGVGKSESRGYARVKLGLQTDISDKNGLLFGEIVASCYTIAELLHMLRQRQPKPL